MNPELPELSTNKLNFLLHDKWQKDVRQNHLKKATTLVQDSKVKLLKATDHQGTLFFEFEVKDGPTYQSTLISRESEVGISLAVCSCSDWDYCSHLVAAVMHLKKLYQKSSSKDVARDEVDQWVSRLHQSLEADPNPKPQAKKSSSNQQVVYILNRSSSGLYLLQAKKARFLKDGSISIDRGSIRDQLDRYNCPSYIDPSELELLNEIRFVSRASNEAYCIHSEQSRFPKLLEQCGKTERLCMYQESDSIMTWGARRKAKKIKWSEARTLVPSWTTGTEGLLEPSILVEPNISEHIHCQPKVFIDRERGEAGILKQEHPDAFLEQWLNGPSIEQSQVDKLSEALKTPTFADSTESTAPRDAPITSPRMIPLPPKQKILRDLHPQPILTVQRANLTPSNNLFLHLDLENILVGKISFYYGAISIPDFPRRASHSCKIEDTLYSVVRDLKKEDQLRQTLAPFELHSAKETFTQEVAAEHGGSQLFSPSNSENTRCWVEFLENHKSDLESQGWLIESEGDLGYDIQEFDDFYEDLEPSDNDWFKFDLGIQHNGQRISLIPALANAFISGQHEEVSEISSKDQKIVISLDETTFFHFPALRFKKILEKVRDLFEHLNSKGLIELPRLRAAQLVNDLDLAKANKTLADLATLGKKLNGIEGLPPTSPSPNLKASLRDYQREGFEWLQFLHSHNLNGILADDMGLGKTIQTLAHILSEKEKNLTCDPILVISPTSVTPNWQSEAEKFTPSLKVLALIGPRRKEHFKDLEKYDLILTSYPVIRRDAEFHKKQNYHMVVLDESQYIKNAASKTTKAICELSAKHRLCLSGTPMENHLGELWSAFNFLMPGLLESSKSFNSTFRNPIEKQGDTTMQTSLSRRTSPLILRRTKEVVAKELPPKTIIPHYIELNEAQIDLYESVRATMDERVREAIANQGFSKSHIVILDALLKLRQICCHPKLLSIKSAKSVKRSAKFDYLTQLLKEQLDQGRRILLFSQFTKALALIEEHLQDNGIDFVKITGQTKDRKTPVDTFQKGKVSLFLISLKAGGTGLNLTAADTVIHFDPWWNPAAENQATDRAYRIGQKKPVFVHKLICTGTIEEQIQVLQEKKAKLVESLLSESTNNLKVDAETIGNLLAPIPRG